MNVLLYLKMLMHIILEEDMGFEPMERLTVRKFSRFVQ